MPGRAILRPKINNIIKKKCDKKFFHPFFSFKIFPHNLETPLFLHH